MHSLLLTSIPLLFLLLVPFSAHAYAFYRDLSVGMTGEDVRALQRLLNERPETLVATAGAGARGQETTYFGPKTAAAVARYQALFASDILSPLGLTSGTGFVGPSTRAKLIADGGTPQTTEPPTATEAPVVIDEADFEATPIITALSREYLENGARITIHGRGFTRRDNEIHTNRGLFEDVSSSDGRTLVFVFPYATEPSPFGVADGGIFVENDNGKSNPILFVIGR